MSKLKYYDSLVVFQEIPDEITLAINITNCPHRCEGCHSPHLREDIGEELTREKLRLLVDANPHITCICFMGGDAQHEEIRELCLQSAAIFPSLKLGFYSGNETLNPRLVDVLDYYKIGPYIEARGPLNSPSTNQSLFENRGGLLFDITYKFWKEVK